MASAGTSARNGRRKSLDAEINLVPFIDLLSMCICFLLMTAVWMEIGALQVKQLVGTSGAASNTPSYEMDVQYVNNAKMEVALKYPGKKSEKLTVQGATTEERISKLQVALGGLGSLLKLNPNQDMKTQLGKTISVARVTTMTGISYGELVSVMDALRERGILNLGVVPVRK